MKKIIPVMCAALASVTVLASCRSNKKSSDPVTDSSSESLNIYNEWIKNVSFNETALNADEVNANKESSKSYYQVQLPLDINASKRVSVSQASKFDSIHDKVYANYTSTNSLKSDQYNKVIDVLNTDTTVDFFDKISNEIDLPDGYLENTSADSRVVSVVYVPVKVVYVKYKKSTLQSTTIIYVLAPIYSSLTTKTDNKIADENVSSLSTISFTINKSGTIVDPKE